MTQIMDDLEKAEFHLKSKRQISPFVAAAFGLLTFFMPFHANAGQGSCTQSLKTVNYAASFKWKNNSNALPIAMRLVVGTPKGAPLGRLTAQIWSENRCEASCQPGTFEKEGPWSPIALQMECKSANLGAFSTTATLLWGRGRSTSKLPTLRFGTWLVGYQQAPLVVELDRYSLSTVSIHSPVAGRRLAYRSLPGLNLQRK